MHQLRDYQVTGVESGYKFLTDPEYRLTVRPDGVPYHTYAAPTGSGKSVVMIAIKHRLDDDPLDPDCTYVVVPSDEILKGFVSKDQRIAEPYRKLKTAKKRKDYLESHGYYTPVRLRNLLLKGSIPAPKRLIIDEGHHDEAETYKLLHALAGNCPAICYTATPYRGTAKSTVEFRKTWGDPEWMIHMSESVRLGYTTFPTCTIVPLLDDDIIDVKNGEFEVRQVESQVIDVVTRTVQEVRDRCRATEHPDGGERVYRPNRPTMMCLPSVYAAEFYTGALRGAGIDADLLVGETPDDERNRAYERCVACEAVLVQVAVVGEGVDLPIRCIIDLSPTMSPVCFLQRFGRCTRPIKPGEQPPEYVCCNRNTLRHAYTLDGLLPPEKYVEMENKFPERSRRKVTRAFGFDGLGKFASVDVPLHNGTNAQLVCIERLYGNQVRQFAALASPLHGDVLTAMRVNIRQIGDTYNTTYGTWEQIGAIPDLENGFTSLSGGDLTPSQEHQWKTYGRWYGLDSEATVTRKQYAALPLLRQCGFRFR